MTELEEYDSYEILSNELEKEVNEICLTRNTYRTSQLATVSEDCTVVVTDVSDDKSQQIYSSASHRDFVQGVSWAGDGRLYTCGWDGHVWPHTVTTLDNQTVIEAEPVNMEVNGFSPGKENGTPQMEKVPRKDCGDSVQLDTPQSEPLLPQT